jgi:hypothetical protein
MAVIQTDTNGNFTFGLSQSKNVLLAAHIEATIDGEPGSYFWLVPVNLGDVKATNLVLSGENVNCRKKKSQMPIVTLPRTKGGFVQENFWLNRVRDVRRN